MVPHPFKIRGEFRLTCCTLGGVEDIKASLREGQVLSTNEIPIEIKLIASPMYEITTNTVRKNEGLTLVADALKKIEESISKKGGNIVIINKPEIVGDYEKDIDEQIKEAQLGDDNDDEEEEENHEEGITANIEDFGEENFDL